MSESGVPQFPSAPPKLPERTERFGNEGDEQRVRITRLPRDLSNVREVTKVRGEVIEVRRDVRTNETNVRIRTQRGEVEVRLPPEQHPPERGQRVEVEIAPNRDPARPPDQAIVRPVQTEAPQQQSTPPPVSKEALPHAQRPATTPVNIEVGTQPLPRVTLDPPQIVPNTTPRNIAIPGDIIRLAPLLPQNVATIRQTAQSPDLVVKSVVSPVISEAQIIAVTAQNTNLTGALNVLRQPSELPQQIPGVTAAMQTVQPPSVTFAPPSIKNMTPAQILGRAPAPTTNLTLITPELTAGDLKGMQPALVNAPLSVQILPVAEFIDAKIEAVKPPQVQITDPKDNGKAEAPEAQKTQSIILGNQQPGTLAAVIVGATLESLPILGLFQPQTGALQYFTLQSASENLIPGTQLQITPQSISTISATATLPPFSTYLTPQSWPIMEEILQTLMQTAPQSAQAFSNIIPSPANPAQITPAALFFIAAVRGMDINGWLGDKALDALRRDGKGNIINRLSAEGGLLSRLSSKPVSQDWRAINLPMFYEGDIHKIALYYKQDQQNSSDEGQKGQPTRFIFNLSLDAMGKVQLDGLFRGGRLDIILRTESVFSQAVQADMRQTYAKALRQTGVTGELSFQNQPEQWVTIQVEDEESFGAEA